MTDDPIVPVPRGAATVDDDEAFCSACGKSYPLELDTCPLDGALLTKLKSLPDTLLGRVFEGRYEVRTTLGHGGMGTVYRGWQLSVDREVAIKVIHTKLARDRTVVKRFLREARLSSRLSQPSIVNVYDFGQTDDGILYIVMELLRGRALSSELDSQQAMPLKRVIAIGLQLCDALDAAHRQGIIHRDLKPGNIVLLDEPPGRDLIKVLDFGLAKTLTSDSSTQVTNTNALLGTPLYMAPEQIASRPTDQRTDLYALGCLLYQMVSGRPPFIGDSVNAVLAMHVNNAAPPLPTGTPPGLVAVISQLMEKEPAQRIAAAATVRAALLQITSDVSDATPQPTPRPLSRSNAPIAMAVTDPTGPDRDPPASMPVRRSRKLAVVAVAAFVVAGVAFVVTRTRSSPTSAPIDAALAVRVVPDAAIGPDAFVAQSLVDHPDAAVDTAPDASPPDAAIKRRPPPPPPPPRLIDASDDPGFIKPEP